MPPASFNAESTFAFNVVAAMELQLVSVKQSSLHLYGHDYWNKRQRTFLTTEPIGRIKASGNSSYLSLRTLHVRKYKRKAIDSVSSSKNSASSMNCGVKPRSSVSFARNQA